MMHTKLLVVTDNHGKILASAPTKVETSKEGPSGIVLQALDAQTVHEIELPKNAAKLSAEEVFASFRIQRHAAVKVVGSPQKRRITQPKNKNRRHQAEAKSRN